VARAVGSGVYVLRHSEHRLRVAISASVGGGSRRAAFSTIRALGGARLDQQSAADEATVTRRGGSRKRRGVDHGQGAAEAEKVIRALKHLANKHPQRKKLGTELGYFRKNKKRMRYAALKAQGFMIGSGVVEAACKTLVTQRLKQSGMRWSVDGAQAILTPRGWDQSDRFDEAWALLAATFHAEVTTLANVVAFKPKPPERPKRARATSR
jgi:hypothetical protein